MSAYRRIERQLNDVVAVMMSTTMMMMIIIIIIIMPIYKFVDGWKDKWMNAERWVYI